MFVRFPTIVLVALCYLAAAENCVAQSPAATAAEMEPALPGGTSVEPPVSGELTNGNSRQSAAPENVPAYRQYPQIGIGANVWPLGVGIEVARPLSTSTNLRAGFNTFHYANENQTNGINYSAKLKLISVEGIYDWYVQPGFHLSPGALFYNGNQLIASASVPSGQTFSLANVPYVSDPAEPVSGSGKLDFFKVSPMILAGFGNIAPRNGKRVSFRFEFGGVYQGTPRVAMSLAGSVCKTNFSGCMNVASNAEIQSDIQVERQSVIHYASRYGLFPLISMGIAFRL